MIDQENRPQRSDSRDEKEDGILKYSSKQQRGCTASVL